MGIDEKYFRDYHKIVGGEYLDLWHASIDTILPANLSNDVIITLYADHDWGWFKEEHPRAELFFESAEVVFNRISKFDSNSESSDSGFLVSFSW